MRAPHSLPPAYFERMFAQTADPWNFETSPYERAKYAHTLAALGGRRYRSGLEIGCANGVLTDALAPSCEALLAIDVSATALERARSRCAAQGHVGFARMAFPGEAPRQGGFDLIMLSEVVYYWDRGDTARAAGRLLDLLALGGEVVLVHWTGPTDYPQSGDDAVLALRADMGSGIETVLAERRPEYRLDLWRRARA